ncbi:MAG: hypothetical protein AAGJ37_14605 [Pseudomonadota bacterium]
MKQITLNKAVFALLAGAFIWVPNAIGHEMLKPKNGGIVQEEHDLVFELVREADRASLFVRDHDHDAPVNTKDMTGSLIILASGKKTEFPLVHIESNKMIADVVLVDGSKVLVKVKEEGHHVITVRYSF